MVCSEALLGVRGQTCLLRGDRALVETTLAVLSAVDKVRVVESQLNGAVQDVIGSLDTEHERVVLITDLVSPAAEAAAGVDVHILELGKKLLENSLALQSRGRVTVVELAVVGGDDLVLRLDHLGVDQTLNTVAEKVGLIHGLLGRLRHLQHDRPVRTLLGLGALRLAAISQLLGGELGVLLGLVVRRVVGEDGGTVEGAVVLREVELSSCQ